MAEHIRAEQHVREHGSKTDVRRMNHVSGHDAVDKKSTPAPEILHSSATVYFHNDWDVPVTCSLRCDGNYGAAMNTDSGKFWGGGTAQPGSVISGNVETSGKVLDIDTQSYFTLIVDDQHTIKFGLGSGQTNPTTRTFADFQLVGICCANDPEWLLGFDFHVFSGPGYLPPLGNSVLGANLPAMMTALPYTLMDNVVLAVLDIPDPRWTYISYAGLSLITVSGRTVYQLNCVLYIDQAHIGLTYHKLLPIDIEMKHASVFVQIQIDPSLETSPVVSTVAVEFDAGDGFKDNTGIQPDNPLAVASKYNTDPQNSKIKAWLTGKLSGMVSSAAASAGVINSKASTLPPAISSLLKQAPDISSPAPSTIVNISNWMSDPQIQKKTLSQIKFVSTHDSATYNLTSSLSQIQYNDIMFLWGLSAANAPLKTWPLPDFKDFIEKGTGTFYIGQKLHDFVMQNGVKAISKVQDLSIYDQLEAGVRGLDLRVYWDTSTTPPDFYTQHAARGPLFKDILIQMKTWIDDQKKKYPNSAELIYATIGATNFGQAGTESTSKALSNLILEVFGSTERNLVYFVNTPGYDHFVFDTLKDAKLVDMTSPGETKVMFMNNNTTLKFYDPITTTDYIGGAGSLTNTDYQVLIEQQTAWLVFNKQPFWSVNYNMPLSAAGMLGAILPWLLGKSGTPTYGLQTQATWMNNQIAGILDNVWGGYHWNNIGLDWAEKGTTWRGVNPIEYVILMNYDV